MGWWTGGLVSFGVCGGGREWRVRLTLVVRWVRRRKSRGKAVVKCIIGWCWDVVGFCMCVDGVVRRSVAELFVVQNQENG